MSETIISVKNLKKYFDVKDRGKLHAVDDLSFDIKEGETLGLVGESGCGKSTTGRVLLRLIPATGGQVIYRGEDVLAAKPAQLKVLRRKMQMIFQDPYSCLDPRKTVRQIIAEPLLVQKLYKGRALWQKVEELMAATGVTAEMADKFPHELDGGRRQRVGITRALALNPEFIVCDEPVSALDVSIQAQILNLLQDLQEKMGLTYLFISHDLSVVKHISQRIMVMYLGRIVEEATSEELFQQPLHPYSQALLSAIPVPKIGKQRERIILKGDVPSPINPAPGCRFAKRCWRAEERCSKEEPVLREVAPGHRVACHLL
ncbi:MAG: ATP-binding cassette domain-containing protein [Firmicutes bacterium]|nr:ATP-binding cassette domain-containing protein [Bacillota bacterium]